MAIIKPKVIIPKDVKNDLIWHFMLPLHSTNTFTCIINISNWKENSLIKSSNKLSDFEKKEYNLVKVHKLFETTRAIGIGRYLHYSEAQHSTSPVGQQSHNTDSWGTPGATILTAGGLLVPQYLQLGDSWCHNTYSWGTPGATILTAGELQVPQYLQLGDS